jgi:hypothetical protein
MGGVPLGVDSRDVHATLVVDSKTATDDVIYCRLETSISLIEFLGNHKAAIGTEKPNSHAVRPQKPLAGSIVRDVYPNRLTHCSNRFAVK